MCTPLVPLAGAINTIDQTRKNVLGWQGKDEQKTTKVTNNYYGKSGEEGELETGSSDTPAKNKNTLKVGGKK